MPAPAAITAACAVTASRKRSAVAVRAIVRDFEEDGIQWQILLGQEMQLALYLQVAGE